MKRSRGNANCDANGPAKAQAKYVIIGAGIHGLSTARHLASELRASGRGGGRDILVIDKTRIGAGAPGIACGVIRNNYFQPGTVSVVVPLLLARGHPTASGATFGLALPLLGLGAAIFLRCAWDFVVFGQGTSAPIDQPKPESSRHTELSGSSASPSSCGSTRSRTSPASSVTSTWRTGIASAVGSREAPAEK